MAQAVGGDTEQLQASGSESASSTPWLHGPQLWSRVLAVYREAQESGAATKTETQVHLVLEPSINTQFVVRLAAALRSKPPGSKPSTQSAAAPPPANPFLPYEQALWVSNLSDSHVLLLNKFNVVAHHVLVVTRAFESQQDPLNAKDLGAAWAVLQAMPRGGVAFYNCGPLSGRSQPHKHMQIVPLPLDYDPCADDAPPGAATGPLDAPPGAAAPLDAPPGAAAPLDAPPGAAAPLDAPPGACTAPLEALVLAAAEQQQAPPYQVLAVHQLPYRCYAAKLGPSPSPEQLQRTYSGLMDAAGIPHTLAAGGGPAAAAAAGGAAAAPASYNVVLTPRLLMLVPRGAEACGPLAINSLGFAGTILVRSDEEVAYVRSSGPAAVLRHVGQPW